MHAHHTVATAGGTRRHVHGANSGLDKNGAEATLQGTSTASAGTNWASFDPQNLDCRTNVVHPNLTKRLHLGVQEGPRVQLGRAVPLL